MLKHLGKGPKKKGKFRNVQHPFAMISLLVLDNKAQMRVKGIASKVTRA